MVYEFGVYRRAPDSLFSRTKDGYHFVGWNTKPDGTGTSFMNQQKVLNLTSTKNETITLPRRIIDTTDIIESSIDNE